MLAKISHYLCTALPKKSRSMQNTTTLLALKSDGLGGHHQQPRHIVLATKLSHSIHAKKLLDKIPSHYLHFGWKLVK
jgi:hypothetical protein